MENIYKPGILFKCEKTEKILIRSNKENIEISDDIKNKSILKSGHIVGYILKDNFAIKLESANLLSTEFLKNRKSYNHEEWGLITRVIPHLLDEEIYQEVYLSKTIWMEFVYDYLKKYNLEFCLKNYEVRIIENGRWKPGDDDYAYIAIEDKWKNKSNFKLEFNYEVKSGYYKFKDKYLLSFFPEIKKVLLSKNEYKAYSEIIKDFKISNPLKWKKAQEEANQLNENYKIKAVNEYKFENHLRYLIDEVTKKVYYHKKFDLHYNYCSNLNEYFNFKELIGERAFNEKLTYQ